ncbi:hypothetical protein AeMF1_019146 [Aphanomyces euteiches]|nr:hypothetical protein AeMF1_019146 [Aphanomyces euteiches]
MSRTTPIHHPYSFKKEVLDAWKDAQKEEGMTKVKVSRMHRVTISTFDKWLAKADEIAKVENGSSKHLRGRSKRGAYSKERPNNEKKGSDQHVNQLADQEADEQNNQLTDQQADRQDDQLADQEANQHVNELADQEANHHVNELTDQQATQHINQLIDQQPGQHIVQLTDEPLIDRQTERPVNQLTFFGDLFDEDLQNSDGLDETKRKRPRLYNDYESADEDNYRKAYTHIDQSLPLRGRTNKARSFSSGSKYNSGIHNDRCYRCSRRSPCVDWRKCSNVDSRHECASVRCSAGKYCQNNVIQQKRSPKTTVVVDPTFGFGLRLDENVPKDTKIIEYVGQLITKDTYLLRKEKGRGQLAWYIARVSREDDNLFVDATKYGNASRFINHACSPNCCFETWYVDKKPRLMVVSRLPLEKGCLLSLHYMDSTWGFPCQCGFCDGTYLPPPTDINDD